MFGIFFVKLLCIYIPGQPYRRWRRTRRRYWTSHGTGCRCRWKRRRAWCHDFNGIQSYYEFWYIISQKKLNVCSRSLIHFHKATHNIKNGQDFLRIKYDIPVRFDIEYLFMDSNLISCHYLTSWWSRLITTSPRSNVFLMLKEIKFRNIPLTRPVIQVSSDNSLWKCALKLFIYSLVQFRHKRLIKWIYNDEHMQLRLALYFLQRVFEKKTILSDIYYRIGAQTNSYNQRVSNRINNIPER